MQRGSFAAIVFLVVLLAGVANAGVKERREAYDAGLAADAWSLFEDPEVIQTRMIDDIRENLAARGIVLRAAAPAEKAA